MLTLYYLDRCEQSPRCLHLPKGLLRAEPIVQVWVYNLKKVPAGSYDHLTAARNVGFDLGLAYVSH
jgi:hypothetical protein